MNSQTEQPVETPVEPSIKMKSGNSGNPFSISRVLADDFGKNFRHGLPVLHRDTPCDDVTMDMSPHAAAIFPYTHLQQQQQQLLLQQHHQLASFINTNNASANNSDSSDNENLHPAAISMPVEAALYRHANRLTEKRNIASSGGFSDFRKHPRSVSPRDVRSPGEVCSPRHRDVCSPGGSPRQVCNT